MEIWEDNQIKYIVAQVDGHRYPAQDSNQDREDIVELIQLINKDKHILDLIGVYDEGKEIWHDKGIH